MGLNYVRRFSAYVSTFYHSEYITVHCISKISFISVVTVVATVIMVMVEEMKMLEVMLVLILRIVHFAVVQNAIITGLLTVYTASCKFIIWFKI